ncbi:hypothetical protein D3C84_1066270 [compost metagenome]
MPARWKPANLSASTVPGLASMVISQSGVRGMRARTPSSSACMASTESRLGVPPPIKMEESGRPWAQCRSWLRSSSRAATYSRWGSSPFWAWELKSQ